MASLQLAFEYWVESETAQEPTSDETCVKSRDLYAPIARKGKDEKTNLLFFSFAGVTPKTFI